MAPDTAAGFSALNEIEHALLTLYAHPRDVPSGYGWREVAHVADEAARSAVAQWLRERAADGWGADLNLAADAVWEDTDGE